jgi:putative cofactor-binding repeat protein
MTGFANSEEATIGLTQVVPFHVEDMLKGNGGIYSKAADWQPHVVVDGNLITGQNPASAQEGGRAVLQQLVADATPNKEREQ